MRTRLDDGNRRGGPGARTHRDSGLGPGVRRILHLDVDAFLASVEQALHPELRGLPVVVGGPPSSRNLVMSCSYEARRFGLRPGMRLAEAGRRCPQAVFRYGDAQAAAHLRERLAHLLMRWTPRVEVTSIDDFLIDLTGTARLHGAACEAAAAMRAAIRDELCLPVTIGVGSSCLMARLAGKLGKPGGVAEILPGHEQAFLDSLPVEQLPGVGHVIGALLARFAIRTVGELRLVSREVLFASFGRDGLVLFERARGRDPRRVEPTWTEDRDGVLVARPTRSIRRETTFEPEEGRAELIEAMLGYLTERAAHRLRRFGLVARSIEVRLRYVDTRPRPPAWTRRALPRGSESLSHAKRSKLPEQVGPTDSTDELWRAARALLRALPRRRALVKRVGVALLGLAPAGGWQGRLFSDSREWSEPDRTGGHGESRADRQRRLDRALDGLRERQGFGRVLRGTSLPLVATHPLGRDGFRLRTPSLNQ